MPSTSKQYPPIEPTRTGMLPVDDLHTLYWEESGNAHGVPVVLLHGGPGSGTSPQHRQFFDPAFYRIILFDQRGAGQSTPLGETRSNTTALLVADMEELRAMLVIDQWVVFGGSWGSTLALAYAQAHPQRCLGLLLRATMPRCACRQHGPGTDMRAVACTCCHKPTKRMTLKRTPMRWRWRVWRRTIFCTTASWSRSSCCAAWPAWQVFRR